MSTSITPVRPEDPSLGAPRIGDVVQGRYRLLEAIGAGGMGTVYRGERLGLGRPVAIKFLHAFVASDPARTRHFEVEAQAMARLSHPNCISVIDFGLQGLPYLVMDLIEGTELRVILNEGPLPARRAVSIAEQVLAGLAHAHAHGIIHRDVKPENILVQQTTGLKDHVRILDFGLAKLTDSGSILTKGMCLGTPHYMAPEQLDETPVDARVDLYTTGIVLYEMLTGRRPFDGPQIEEVFLQQKQMAPPPFRVAAPEIPLSATLEAVVRRALEKSPAARFSSALEMREALDGVSELSADPPAFEQVAARPAEATLAEATLFEPVPFGAPPEETAPRPAEAPGNVPRVENTGVRVKNRIRAVLRAAREQATHARPSALGFWRWVRGRSGPGRPWVSGRRRTVATILAVGSVALLVALLASPRRHSPATEEPPPAATPGKLADIDELVARGERKQAIARLRELRKAHPADADYAAAMARLCFEQRRYAEAAAALRAAIRNDPQLRDDALLIGHVIDSLQNDDFAGTAEDLLRDLGRTARSQVKEASRSHRNARVRSRCRDLARDWDRRPFFRSR